MDTSFTGSAAPGGETGGGRRPLSDLLESLRRHRVAAGDGFPRVGLFLLGCGDAAVLSRTVARIPEGLEECLAEVVALGSEAGGDPTAAKAAGAPRFGLRLLRPFGRASYGALRKQAFEYALERGLDVAVVMRGDGRHPPEALPWLLHPALVEGRSVVFASRLGRTEAVEAGMPLLFRVAHALASGVQNRVLGLRLHDYLTSFRVYAAPVLRAIPFHLNADDPAFDAQLTIQCRALGVTVHEAGVPDLWREHLTVREGLRQALRACAVALEYRLHQLHVIRRGQYFVDHGVHYSLKRSPTGSHMQIVGAIRPDSDLLDLGCSQGLLAGPLRAKGVRVTGVDVAPPERLVTGLEEYHRRDLEQPLDLPPGRAFAYVVIADVIEHLRNRAELLRESRRLLTRDGRLIISTPNIALWFYRLSLLVGRFEYGPRGVLDRTHVHLYTRASFRRQVERAGFRIVKERVTALPFEVVFESTGRSRLVRGLSRAYHRLARLWPEMFAYQFILEAELALADPDPGRAPD